MITILQIKEVCNEVDDCPACPFSHLRCDNTRGCIINDYSPCGLDLNDLDYRYQSYLSVKKRS